MAIGQLPTDQTNASLPPLSTCHKSTKTNQHAPFLQIFCICIDHCSSPFHAQGKLLLILIMGQNQYWTANYRSDCLLIITLHHVNSILICLAFYSNQDMIIKLTFIKSTTFSPFLNVIFFRFPIINLFTVEVSSNCNTLKNKKKFHPFQKYPTQKHGTIRMEIKQLSVYTCVHEVQQISSN